MKLRTLAILFLLIGMFSPSFATAAKDITLLMIPREDAPVRLGMDVGNRYPTLLLSYKVASDGAVSLHGWSGTEWVKVTLEAYEEGSFFPAAPSSALIVEVEGEEVPETLIPSPAWCPAVFKITTSETRPLLHLVGHHYDFKYKDWKWFAENYHVAINDINPEGLNIHWYHQRLGDNLKKKESLGNSDLQYFMVIRSTQLNMDAEPDVLPEETVDTDSSTEEEHADVIEENPLTNEVPEAVVDTGDADESVKAEAAPADGEPEEQE